MKNIIIIAIVLLLLSVAVIYVIKAKKKGQKCIGCPDAKSCQACKCNTKHE